MNDIQKRFALFLIGCIGTRALATYLATIKSFQHVLGIVALIISIGFLTIYLTDSRKTGGEVFGQQIWWNQLRPVHSLLFFITAIMLFQSLTNAWVPLAADTALGLGAFLYYHYSESNFEKLI